MNGTPVTGRASGSVVTMVTDFREVGFAEGSRRALRGLGAEDGTAGR